MAPLPETIGLYRVERQLGAGAMGVVYQVVHPQGRRYALKLLNPSLTDGVDVARFMREVELQQRYPHSFFNLSTAARSVFISLQNANRT